MTNEIIDKVLIAIEDAHDQIESLDNKTTKKRSDLTDRLRLVKTLASLEKQLASFGTRGAERKKLRESVIDAHFVVWMAVHDPEKIADARALLAKHDPELLHRLDTEVRDDEYQRMRLKVIGYMFAEQPKAVQDEMIGRFLEQVRDNAGNLPQWLHKRLGPELTISEGNHESQSW